MTDNKPKEPYVYKLYDMQDKEHRTIQAIFGVAGCNPTARGISLDLAEQIVDWLKQIANLAQRVKELEEQRLELFKDCGFREQDIPLNANITDIKLSKRYSDLTKANEDLKCLVIWMTGCGYDFCQHPYFVEQRDRLLKNGK